MTVSFPQAINLEEIVKFCLNKFLRVLFLFCLFFGIESFSNPLVNLLQNWAKDNSGQANFLIMKGNTETPGVIHWNFEKCYWKFEYPDSCWEIMKNCIKKTQNGKTKTYPCTGFISFLVNPISQWHEKLKFQSEVCEENNCILVAYFQKHPMIWRYQKVPFKIDSWEMTDNAGNYFRIIFGAY